MVLLSNREPSEPQSGSQSYRTVSNIGVLGLHAIQASFNETMANPKLYGT